MENVIDEVEEFAKILSDFRKDGNVITDKFGSYGLPDFKISKTGDGLIKCGRDNMFPNYLIRLRDNSAVHGGILNSKAQDIYGLGLKVEDSEDNDQRADIYKFLKSSNAGTVLKRIIEDFVLFNYFSLILTWDATRTKIEKISHIDASMIRIYYGQMPNYEHEGDQIYYGYSKNWKEKNRDPYRPIWIHEFSADHKGTGCPKDELMFISKYEAGVSYYSLPSYYGGASAIELNYRIPNFMNSALRNGLAPSLHVAYFGKFEKEDKQKKVTDLIKYHGGDSETNKAIVTFDSSPANATQIKPLENYSLAETYNALSEYSRDNIVLAHSISPVLANISIPGQLGLSNETKSAAQLYYSRIIEPVQTLMTETINNILDFNGYTIPIYIQHNKPISFLFADETLTQIATLNELRKMAGFTVLDDANKANLVAALKDSAGGKSASESNKTSKVMAPNKEQQDEQQGLSSELDASPEEIKLNEIMRTLTAYQRNSMDSIYRKYSKHKLTRDQARIQLKAFGLNPDEIELYLGEEPQEIKPNSIDEILTKLKK